MKQESEHHRTILSIDELECGDKARIVDTGGLPPELSRRFADLGLMPGEKITFIRRAPWGGPVWLRIKGYSLAFRAEQARLIRVERVTADSAPPQPEVSRR